MEISLRKALKFPDCLALVVGSMIGTGVFLKSGSMVQMLGSPLLVLLAWTVAGLLSLAGALTYAEIGSRFPKAGGEYIYLREAYGQLPAFLFGWTRVWIATPASIAAYGVGSATFASPLIDIANFGGLSGLAILFIAIFTGINCLAVIVGGHLQVALTFLKYGLILAIIVGVFGFSDSAHVNHFFESSPRKHDPSSLAFLSSFASAIIAALWAYDGWNNLAMASGEVVRPQRNIPRSLVYGTMAVMTVYILINAAFFFALPLADAMNSNSTLFVDAPPIAAKAVLTFATQSGLTILTVGFVLSALGSMHGSMLTGARVPYAMALDGMFFKSFARVHTRTRVPVTAIVFQGFLACAMALSGSFDQLTDLVVVASWVFYAAVTWSVFRLRKRKDVPEASYRTWGYPVTPVVFCLTAILLTANMIYVNPSSAAIGFAFLCLGVPVFFYLNRRSAIRTIVS